MKKVYIKPECGTLTVWGQNILEGYQSYNFVDSREQRDDRFEDYEDNSEFWDE